MILDRDIQCDFNNEFWEETGCNWRYDTKFIESIGLDPSVNRFKRKLANNEHTNGGYWRFHEMKSDNYFLGSEAEGFYTLVSPVLIENGPRQFYPQFGFAMRGKKMKLKIYFVAIETLERHIIYSEDRDTQKIKMWEYLTFNLTENVYLKAAWDSGVELKWRIILHFEIKPDGNVAIDNLGPCSLEEIFFPQDSTSGKMIGSCFRVQVCSIVFVFKS